MKIETQGYGSSMVATKYVYERLKDIQECVQMDWKRNKFVI